MSTSPATSGPIGIQIDGMDAMLKAFAQAPDTVSPIMQKAITGGAALLAKYTTRATVPWFTGNLVHSFREEISPLMARWFPTANYAAAVNDGSRPHMPPYKSEGFNAWATAHDMNPYLLARSISRKGTKANPFMDRIKLAATPQINSLFGDALERVTAALSKA